MQFLLDQKTTKQKAFILCQLKEKHFSCEDFQSFFWWKTTKMDEGYDLILLLSEFFLYQWNLYNNLNYI